MSFFKINKYVVVGFKVIAFIASGISAFIGVKELIKPKTNSKDDSEVPPISPSVENSSIIEETAQQVRSEEVKSDIIVGESGMSRKGQKIIGVLGIISSVCLGIFEVVRSLGTVTDSVDRLFRRRNHTNLGRDYIPGDYPWNNPERSGYPNNTPIYRGPDGGKDSIYWIQRDERITEIW